MTPERPDRPALRDRRPKGVAGIAWALIEAAATGRSEPAPTLRDYPATLVRRIRFPAGGGLGWTLSALETPRAAPAPWKIVVITGAPSWSEYWAPVLAALPEQRHMVVVERPGFAQSQPPTCVPDIRIQAQALIPLLDTAPGQQLLLVGQSYGAAIAAVMAAERPRNVRGLVLLSSYLGELGPTSRWLVAMGERMGPLVPRDLRHAIMEVQSQPAQLVHMHRALKRLRTPIHVIHGDQDDFAPREIAEKLVADAAHPSMRFTVAPGVNHFLTQAPADQVIALLETCIPAPAEPRWRWTPPKIAWPWRPAAKPILPGPAKA